MYQQVIGFAALPPYWALGFHQGSAGYTTPEILKTAVDGYQDQGFALDAVYFDTASLDSQGRNFQIDPVVFAELPKHIEELHEKNIKVVTMAQSAISADDYVYDVLMQILQKKCAIRSVLDFSQYFFDGSLTASTKYTDHSIFLDFMNKDAVTIWANGLGDLYEQL
jgi:alpha-glucosidase